MQRLGRIHRNKDTKRPKRLQKNSIYIIEPQKIDNNLLFGNEKDTDSYIYDKYLLIKTYCLLKDMYENNEKIDIKNSDKLIESVYDFDYQMQYESIKKHMEKYIEKYEKNNINKSLKKEFLATENLIPKPGRNTPFINDLPIAVNDDDEFNLFTRYIPYKKIPCLFLFNINGELFLDPYGKEKKPEINSSMRGTQQYYKNIIKLLDQTVNLGNYYLSKHFDYLKDLELKKYKIYEDIYLLKDYFVIELVNKKVDIHEADVCISYDDYTGISLDKISEKFK